ncbi:MAG: glycoside hydrolase family 97 protein [Prevotellaceae bacterium]|nr:glycoside hydrolase family 97 protein [Prevotellaceae bacterium]
MKHLSFIILTLSLAFFANGANAKSLKVASPDGKISVTINDNGGTLSYTTSLDGQALFTQTGLQVKLMDKTIGEGAKILSSKTSKVSNIIKPVVPIKQSTIHNDYTSALVSLKGGYKVEFRVFNNAVAYRFQINEKDSVNVVDETFNLKPADEMTVHFQPTGGWGTSSESPYITCMLKEWKHEHDMSVLPMSLSSTKRDLHLLISESDLRDYAGLYIKGNGDKDCLSGNLVPYYKKWELFWDRGTTIKELAPYAVRTTGQRTLPWRYVVIADSKGIIEQTINAQLAGKCELDDTSWIRPGLVSWDWWNHKSIYGPDVNFKPGCNTDTYKYYIDFASKYGVKYIIMDEGWAKSTSDPFNANPNLDLQECIRYGKQKGVGIILWLTWICVERNLDKIFETYEKWGVAGTKIDFMDRQDQWMINWYERTIKEAAKHHIVVDFHGAMKPAGLEVRYPNLLAYEGVRGLEQMSGCQPDNTMFIPFLRNAVGPADFTPGAMVNTQPEYDKWSDPNCSAVGTRAYSMALFTILETGTQMLADSPTQYYKNPDCIDFLSKVPVTWDETHALEAQFGEYLVVAKRHGEKWYVAGICNGKQPERKFSLPLKFLANGNHQMTIFTDGFNAGQQAMDYRRNVRMVTSADVLDVTMVRNGGFTAVIE